jgi:AcrR family transcriptional regulator
MRKQPLQERSRQRLARIVDAGEKEFATVGFEAATMESIAIRAETSIGSVYQYFPDKRALFHAVAERFETDSRAFFERVVAEGDLSLPLDALVDTVIDAIWEFNVRGDGLRAVWLAGFLSRELLDLAEQMNVRSAEVMQAVLAARAPGLTKRRRLIVARFLVDMVSAMLFVAARSRGIASEHVLDETKSAVKAYLRVALAEGEPEPSPPRVRGGSSAE